MRDVFLWGVIIIGLLFCLNDVIGIIRLKREIRRLKRWNDEASRREEDRGGSRPDSFPNE